MAHLLVAPASRIPSLQRRCPAVLRRRSSVLSPAQTAWRFRAQLTDHVSDLKSGTDQNPERARITRLVVQSPKRQKRTLMSGHKEDVRALGLRVEIPRRRATAPSLARGCACMVVGVNSERYRRVSRAQCSKDVFPNRWRIAVRPSSMTRASSESRHPLARIMRIARR